VSAAAPWHKPGSWLANPVYWDDDAREARAGMPSRIRFIDCTLSEGDDCVGHQLNWNTRLDLLERLDEIGLGEITMASHATYSEERDLVKACRRMGLKTPLVAKGPGITPPLDGNSWKEKLDRHLELGCEVISPIFKWPFDDTLADFSGTLSKQAVVDSIHQSVAYLKSQGVRVVPWIVDAMRTPSATACLFFRAMQEAGTDGVYVVDSRGNSAPLATRFFIKRVREAVGPDRGGCVALEEAAPLFEMYGIATGIQLDKLYELCSFVQKAYGVEVPPWKPILGENWNKEEGAAHLEGSGAAEATIGINPRLVGREFEAVIGSKILFGRERSSAHTDDPIFLRDLVAEWGMQPSEEEFQRILNRARAAVATAYDKHYLTIDEFRRICSGVCTRD
jgi:isopropylmalate/homocitrate/citramalate synthase